MFVLSWVSLASITCLLTAGVSFSLLYTTVSGRTVVLTIDIIFSAVNPFALLDTVPIKGLINGGAV